MTQTTPTREAFTAPAQVVAAQPLHDISGQYFYVVAPCSFPVTREASSPRDCGKVVISEIKPVRGEYYAKIGNNRLLIDLSTVQEIRPYDNSGHMKIWELFFTNYEHPYKCVPTDPDEVREPLRELGWPVDKLDQTGALP